MVGSTDPKANEDVAKGSGFQVGGKGGCKFHVGDQVRIEASDTGTATTIRQVTASGHSTPPSAVFPPGHFWRYGVAGGYLPGTSIMIVILLIHTNDPRRVPLEY